MSALLHTISDYAIGLAIAPCIVSAYIVGARFDSPTDTETAAITAQIDNDRMQEHAAINYPKE